MAALFLLSLITYIDRAAISTAKQPMARTCRSPTRRWAPSSARLRSATRRADARRLVRRSHRPAARARPRGRALEPADRAHRHDDAIRPAPCRALPVRHRGGWRLSRVRACSTTGPAHQRGIANGILFSGGLLGAAFRFRSTRGCSSSTTGALRSTFLACLVSSGPMCWLIWFGTSPRPHRARERECRPGTGSRELTAFARDAARDVPGPSRATSRSTSASPGCTRIFSSTMASARAKPRAMRWSRSCAARPQTGLRG